MKITSLLPLAFSIAAVAGVVTAGEDSTLTVEGEVFVTKTAAPAHLENKFIHVLNGLAAAANWLMPGNPIANQADGAGGTAQIAGLASPPGPNTLRIGQFFPEHTPAANIFDHPRSTMEAIEQVL